MAETAEAPVPVRVLISYAHDAEESSPGHVERVRRFWTFLRAQGIDARLDVLAANEQQDWPAWMDQQLREARFVLVIASPAYRERAEGRGPTGEGRGVRWEAKRLRDILYRDGEAGLADVVSVVLGDGSPDDLPDWLTPASRTWYAVPEFTVTAAEKLLRLLTGQHAEREPPLGPVPSLPSRPLATGDGAPVAGGEQAAPAVATLRTLVEIQAWLDGDVLSSEVTIAGTPLGRRETSLSADVWSVWDGLGGGPAAAGDRLLRAGRALGRGLFDEESMRLVADLVERSVPGSWVDVVLVGDAAAMRVPVELTRLTTHTGADLGPFALLGGVTVSRRLRGAPRAGPTALPGPLKVLAAVAAPDDSRTPNPPLDVEAEMQAVLDAVQPVSDDATAQVRILEVASLDQIRRALDSDAYHVLHLSAHGSPTTIELEDEDGGPVEVGTKALVGALQDAGRPVPLIVLSSCSGAVSTQAMAAGLVTQGADRVIAMQAAVSDSYATALTAHLYADLVRDPAQPIAQALARARRAAESRPGDAARRMPEYGVPMLLAGGPDRPLLDTDAAPAALAQPTVAPSGTSVRELPLGRLIGRRHELRRATAVLRRTPEVLRDLESVVGVQLLGIGGIGKTALAGRLISRLRGDGWAIAVHEGAWNPERLFGAVAAALEAPALADPRIEDEQRLDAVLAALRGRRLLLVLDDFEQNLTRTGDEFLDPAFADVLGALSDACAPGTGGAVLITSRHPVPGQDGSLVRIPLPPLSGAELRRLFLRLPGLNALDRDDQRLISRVIGGHPRLIEFVDALLRGHRAKFPEAQERLKRLAAEAGIDLTRPRPPGKAVDQALVLAAADVFLDILTAALSEPQRAALRQLAICQAPMSVEDLASALSVPVDEVAESVAGLTDLSLLTVDDELLVHPWTARILVERMREEGVDFEPLHERAVEIRFRRFGDGRAGYDDLLDLPHHLAALGDYAGVLAVARRAVGILPGTLSAAAYLAEIQDLVPDREQEWILLSDLRLQQILASGDLRAATRLMQRIHDRVAARAATDPTNTAWQRDLSVSHNRIGNLAVATGDGAAAAERYQASLTIAERLAATDPTNTDWQRDLSISHERLGDLAVATGDGAAAAEHHQAGLTIAERLAATDPTNTDWQRDLSISHERLGDLAVATGDGAAAAEHHQASLTIRQRLAATDPTNTDWQRNLSISHERLGDLAVATGDDAAAAEHHQASLTIAERLAATDPTNTDWQRDLSISHHKLGDLADAAAAAEHFQASLTIAERLAATDPTNTVWQHDLSISHSKLGNLARATGDTAAAAEHFQASLTIRERLAATDPTNTAWQRDLSISHGRLGDLAVATGDSAATAEHFQASLTIAERLAATDPTNTVWQRDLSISHGRLGELAVATGDGATAAEHFQASLTIAERLAATDPTNMQWRQDLERMRARMGAGDVKARRSTGLARLRGRLRRDRGV